MNLESSIKDIISQKLVDGTVEKLVAEHLESGVTKALEKLFGSYGDVTEVIEKKVKSVMVPYLEAYDYSQYITKLDSVLVEVLNNTTLDNKKMLMNFKELMTVDERKEIKVTELFEMWKEYVSKKVETDGLEIDYDDGPSYENVEVTFEIEENGDRDWSSFKYATLTFECEHDENMNFIVSLSRWNGQKGEGWDIRFDRNPNISSLRYIDDFTVQLMRFTQAHTQLIIDSYGDSDEVRPEKEPEAYFE